MISLGFGGLVIAVGTLASGRPLYLWVVPGLLTGMLLTDRFVKLRGGMRSTRFMKQLPDAIDTIIRGIRSGLPVIECIGSVGQEYGDPVGGHFQAISERVMLGEPLRLCAMARRPRHRQAGDRLLLPSLDRHPGRDRRQSFRGAGEPPPTCCASASR